LFNINRQVELFLDDSDQYITIDMPRFVVWSSNGSVCIKRDLIVFSENLALPFFLVNFHDVVELNETFVIDIEFGDEFAELKFFEMDFEALENSLKIINADQTVSIVVQVFNTFSTVANVFLCENVIHFLLFFYYERPNYKSI
jgi:hypothetical protein